MVSISVIGFLAERLLVEVLNKSGFELTSLESANMLGIDQSAVMVSNWFQDNRLKVDIWVCLRAHPSREWIPIQLTVLRDEDALIEKRRKLDMLSHKVAFLKLDYDQLKRAARPYYSSNQERREISRQRIVTKLNNAIEEQLAHREKILTLPKALWREKIYWQKST